MGRDPEHHGAATGPEHPDTLTSLNNLANAYYLSGRYEEAARLYEETLSICEEVLGLEHPNTLASRGNLASGYRGLGQYDEAVRLDEEHHGAGAGAGASQHPNRTQQPGGRT